MTFEDPTQLARCIKSDCTNYRAGQTPLCAQHLRDQEVSAGATSISEPELEAKVAKVRTEDDEHPGQVKVYDRDTGKASWVAKEIYVGPDPDTNGIVLPGPPMLTETPPDPTELEPHWDGSQWVLREKRQAIDVEVVRSLVRRLSQELGL